MNQTYGNDMALGFCKTCGDLLMPVGGVEGWCTWCNAQRAPASGAILPLDPKERKEVPLWTVISQYFPKAMVGVARVSFRANERHNPGQPMHWSREKSSDHKDCIVRHLLDEERIDPETGQPEAVQAAWRALANAELIIERLQAKGILK